MCDVIVKKIEEMGLVASVMDRLDNGVIKYGITIGRSESQKVRPIFYPQSYTGTADEIANAMVSDYLIMEKGLTVDQAFLMSKAAIISNIYVGLQGCFGENIVKRPCEFKGLEEYLYVVKKHGDKYATSKLSEQAISLYGLSVEEAWNAAYENTKASTCIRSMASVLQEFFPGEMPADAETGADFLYVISNQDNYRGAACALAGKEMVMSLAREKKQRE